jgi:hypothetical protein
MNIYTEGIIVNVAKFTMWSVRIGDKVYSSHELSRLTKYLSSPEAKPGVFIHVSYLKVKGINSYSRQSFHGFMDLDNGEFCLNKGYKVNPHDSDVSDGSVVDVNDKNAWKKMTKEELDAVSKVVAADMLDQWKRKFKGNL